MLYRLRPYKYLFFALSMAVLTLFAVKFIQSNQHNEHAFKSFQKHLINKLKMVEDAGNSLISDKEPEIDFKAFNKNDIVVIIYKNDSLQYWSENALSIPVYFPDSLPEKELVKTGNLWCIPYIYKHNSEKYIFFVKIKYAYPYENPYLENSFAKGFHLSVNHSILQQPQESSRSVFDGHGNYLFSLQFNGLVLIIGSQPFDLIFST